MDADGLLVVHAHPDDETLSTGALLATWGPRADVVTCTRGEQGEVIGSGLAHLAGDGPALAAHREQELAAALGALGVRRSDFLDSLPGPDGRTSAARYADSGMAWQGPGVAGPGEWLPAGALVGVDLDDAAGRLALAVRARRPRVVATYGPGGGYGHPDHVRTHQVTMRAVALAADPSWSVDVPVHAVEQVWWAVVPADELRRARAALAVDPTVTGLRAADPRLGLPTGPLPTLVEADEPDVRVDVAPVLDRVLAALAAHATQVQAVTALPGRAELVACYALSDGVLTPVLPTECYRRAGRDRG